MYKHYYYHHYCYRQKAKKLKTAAEETMACAKYSPQVHKLRMLCQELAEPHQAEIYCFHGQIPLP